MLAITTYIEVHGIKLELIASELEHVDDAIIRITAIMEEMVSCIVGVYLRKTSKIISNIFHASLMKFYYEISSDKF